MENNSSGVATTASVGALPVFDPLAQVLASVLQYACVYWVGVLFLPEIMCNSLVVIILLRTPTGTTKTTRIYYVVIGICELFILLAKYLMFFFFGWGVESVVRSINWWSVQNHMFECFVDYFFWFTPEMVANNAYVALGVERLIALTWPMRTKALITQRRAICGVLLLAFLSAIITCVCMTEAIQVNPYLPLRSGCYNGAIAVWLNPVWSIPKYICVYVFPSLTSGSISIALVCKIRTIAVKRASLQQNDSQKVNNNEVESCVTLIIVSTVHMLFYLPLATFRVVAIVLPRVTQVSSTVSTQLVLLGMNLYVSIMPVHLMNFSIYFRRVKAFKSNVINVLTCRPLV